MNKEIRTKIGAFAILSVVLLLTSFIAVGIGGLFEQTDDAVTVVSDSVDGLSVGAPVKYKGLPVGRVRKISVRSIDGYIAIYFDIYSSAIDRFETPEGTGKDSKRLFGYDPSEFLEARKLVCYVNASGIMGGTFLELGANRKPDITLDMLKGKLPPDVTFVPSSQSHVSNAIQNISMLLEEMSKIDFTKLTVKLDRTLDSMDRVLSKSALEDTLAKANSIATGMDHCMGNLRKLMSDENVEKLNSTVINLHYSTGELNKFMSSGAVQTMTVEVRNFLATAGAFLKDTRSDSDAIRYEAREFRIRLEQSLERIDSALRVVEQLSNSLADHPSQLLRGRSDKSMIPGK
ncbi:MAG: MlaD family protein [Victivallaceae bacterium]|nr:MlaD family protein [Victivallaceae bacterium]